MNITLIQADEHAQIRVKTPMSVVHSIFCSKIYAFWHLSNSQKGDVENDPAVHTVHFILDSDTIKLPCHSFGKKSLS